MDLNDENIDFKAQKRTCVSESYMLNQDDTIEKDTLRTEPNEATELESLRKR